MAAIKSILAFFTSLLITICITLDIPCYPMGEKLDTDKFVQTFEDEFEGDALDTDAWFFRLEGLPPGGFNTSGQVRVADGALTITAQYREDGEHGPGWYSGMLALCQKYCRGYFEIRCKCAPGGGFMFDVNCTIDDGAKPENVEAMFETVREYGKY